LSAEKPIDEASTRHSDETKLDVRKCLERKSGAAAGAGLGGRDGFADGLLELFGALGLPLGKIHAVPKQI
jgi:hypothetical protein